MKNVLRSLSVTWIGVYIALAQSPTPTNSQPFDPAKSPVKVVFAPEFKREAQPTKPVPFAAPHGAIGIATGAESMAMTVATIGTDGKLQLQCAPSAKSAKSSGKSAAHAK